MRHALRGRQQYSSTKQLQSPPFAAPNLAAARLRHVAGSRWSMRRYLNMELLKEERHAGA
jgi:hypothetical protein